MVTTSDVFHSANSALNAAASQQVLRFTTRLGLTLVPTPLEASLRPDSFTLEFLQLCVPKILDGSLKIVVEDLRPARQRWGQWGLPREIFPFFVALNEHEKNSEETLELFKHLQKGGQVCLLSDGGMPGFCDPGGELIKRCNESQIPVGCLPFPNSLMQAHALSGLIGNGAFTFKGFPPQESSARLVFWNETLKAPGESLVMDTAYRLPKVLKEIEDVLGHMAKNSPANSLFEFFIATDLNRESEKCCFWTTMLSHGEVVHQHYPFDLAQQKKDFVLVISRVPNKREMKSKK